MQLAGGPAEQILELYAGTVDRDAVASLLARRAHHAAPDHLAAHGDLLVLMYQLQRVGAADLQVVAGFQRHAVETQVEDLAVGREEEVAGNPFHREPGVSATLGTVAPGLV